MWARLNKQSSRKRNTSLNWLFPFLDLEETKKHCCWKPWSHLQTWNFLG
uniref:Putative disease resistance RPP13-like protein 1 n=1 Tax=Rhizophora mucronata TaxID=61149 RepID=A0A2P2LUQ3_RHIMU